MKREIKLTLLERITYPLVKRMLRDKESLETLREMANYFSEKLNRKELIIQRIARELIEEEKWKRMKRLKK